MNGVLVRLQRPLDFSTEAYLLVKLGWLANLRASPDLIGKPGAVDAGVNVIAAPFVANGNVATGGGCLAARYLAG